MKPKATLRLIAACILLSPLASALAQQEGDGLEPVNPRIIPSIDEIVVTADLRGRTAADVPAALTLIDGEVVEELATQHFEELVRIRRSAS